MLFSFLGNVAGVCPERIYTGSAHNFGVTVCFAIAQIMAPSFREALRCLCELLLLISLWHDTNTSIIAVMSWVSWCMGLHCGSMLSCRSTTWIVVCLSQHDWRTWRLIYLTVLVYFGPLFGKRGAPCNAKSISLKKAKIHSLGLIATFIE